MKPLIQEGRGWYLPRVPEDELMDIYSGAWYYICTSTVDGETIMLKESMKCGTPVIASLLLEDSIDGKGIIIQDPTSIEETAEIFRRIFSYPDHRERYAREGYEWVQTLSWDKTAELALMFLENR
jgi:glycosyltransferase involved in cell wall biosynthesis